MGDAFVFAGDLVLNAGGEDRLLVGEGRGAGVVDGGLGAVDDIVDAVVGFLDHFDGEDRGDGAEPGHLGGEAAEEEGVVEDADVVVALFVLDHAKGLAEDGLA